MKVATGNYFNLYSEEDSDNFGLKVKFDIMIVFPEYFTLDQDVCETLEFMLEGRLRGLGMEKPYAKKQDVKAAVKLVLDSLGYEFERIIVDQAIRCENLKQKEDINVLYT